MQTVKAWKVSVTTMHDGQWKGRFLFKPTRDMLVIAINGDIEDVQRERERCCRDEANEIEYYQERLRQLQDVVLNVKPDFADNQVRQSTYRAGTVIGTVQVTADKVYTL